MSDGHLNAHLLQNILRNIDEGIHVIDQEGRTIHYNEAMEKIEGLRKENVLGRHVLDVFPNLDCETSTLIKALERGREINQDRQSYLNYKGQRITSINVTLPIKDGENTLGAIEIARNVTDVNIMSEKLADLQMKLYGKGGEGSPPGGYYDFGNIVGEDPKLKKIIQYAKKAAVNDSSVFLYGETGTGKEMFAQSIHGSSARSKMPFIAQNCAALPDSLLEGILFGTVKGGFTGAIDRPGLFEQANGGTLFLDEINSMSTHLQAKILRVLQENCLRRIGGTREIQTDVRIVAASNEDPETAISNGTLRKDLYYRVNVISVKIPPLRERMEDLELLTRHFIEYFNKKYAMDVEGIQDEAMEFFRRYHWPGNVRELKNVLESAMNVCSERFLRMGDLPDYLELTSSYNRAGEDKGLKPYMEEIEREMILRTLKRFAWNITSAGKELGISRQNLQYKMKKYNWK